MNVVWAKENKTFKSSNLAGDSCSCSLAVDVVAEETICRGRLYDVTMDNSRVPEVESKKSELVVCLFKPKRRVRAGDGALER